jgi:hypothetical protein
VAKYTPVIAGKKQKIYYPEISRQFVLDVSVIASGRQVWKVRSQGDGKQSVWAYSIGKKFEQLL